MNYNIDNQKNKQIYGSITALDLDGYPIERIEGRITNGTINVDGRSTVRRTCQLTFLPNAFEVYTDYLWGLEKLFKLEIGIFDDLKERIKWYPQGVYVISQFQVSKTTNNLTINLSGKDKMCKLNGEVSGLIDCSAKELDKIENKDGTKTSLPLKEIIRNLVYEFGEEPYHNIIINDIPEYSVELLEYKCNTPMYIYHSENNNYYLPDNIIIDDKKQCVISGEEEKIITLEELDKEYLNNLNDEKYTKYNIYFDENKTVKYAVSRVEMGMTAGYWQIKTIYPEDGTLTANIGESITSILDKIINVLKGEFEYFYNLDGQFVFQLKESFVKTMWGNKDYVQDKEIYDFTQGAYLISLSNTPDIANLKNDFSIWGTNPSDMAIHYRYAIDEKPIAYRSIREDNNNKVYAISEEIANKYYLGIENPIICDWREILYQMADDYFKCHTNENFTRKIKEFNPILFPFGKTKYEQYYRDIEGFWRDLYIDPTKIFNKNEVEEEYLSENIDKYWSNEEKITYYPPGDINQYWNKDVFENPTKLKFFIDFLDSGIIQNFNVRRLGRKAYIEENKDIKAINYSSIPPILYLEPDEETTLSGFKKIQIQHIDWLFSKAKQGISAKEVIEQCLYKYAYCNEAVNITCSPIFDLQPNSSLLLKDKEAQVNGEYIVDKITLSLNYNGNMNITAIKAAEEEVIL